MLQVEDYERIRRAVLIEGMTQREASEEFGNSRETQENDVNMLDIVGKLRSLQVVTVVALGDSTTEETFYTQGRMGWVSLLSEALAEQYFPGCCIMVNAGKGGDTMGGALGRLDRDVLRFAPDLVIVALGLNDALGLEAHLPQFRREMRETVRRIREHNGAEILVRTPNPVVTAMGLPAGFPGRPDVELFPEGFDRSVEQYAQALVEMSAELDLALVDHFGIWMETVRRRPEPPGLMLRMGDALHPGPLGHLVFFRQLAPLFGVSPYFRWEENLNP